MSFQTFLTRSFVNDHIKTGVFVRQACACVKTIDLSQPKYSKSPKVQKEEI